MHIFLYPPTVYEERIFCHNLGIDNKRILTRHCKKRNHVGCYVAQIGVKSGAGQIG